MQTWNEKDIRTTISMESTVAISKSTVNCMHVAQILRSDFIDEKHFFFTNDEKNHKIFRLLLLLNVIQNQLLFPWILKNYTICSPLGVIY